MCLSMGDLGKSPSGKSRGGKQKTHAEDPVLHMSLTLSGSPAGMAPRDDAAASAACRGATPSRAYSLVVPLYHKPGPCQVLRPKIFFCSTARRFYALGLLFGVVSLILFQKIRSRRADVTRPSRVRPPADGMRTPLCGPQGFFPFFSGIFPCQRRTLRI